MSDAEFVDLRSDTVTRPTPEMRRAMGSAEVGDDVYGEDRTMRRLEDEAAARVGHEAALFVPTGTMGNQIAIHLLTRPGTDVIVEAGSHVYNYELGAMAAWSGAMPRVLQGAGGLLDPEAVAAAAAPGPYYMARASLLILENTHNHAGGVVLPGGRKEALLGVARARGLAAHLDGARIFNAAAALGAPAAELARGFDTVMFCLSKGLGAPVGSLLCGSRGLVADARVVRKRMGGAMRQAGILAAAGLVALERHVGRLEEDHHRAARLASVLADLPSFRIDAGAVRTNIVIAEVSPPATAEGVLAGLKERGVLAGGMGPGRVRFVTHLDVDDRGLERAVSALREVGKKG
ncbi:MAG: low specificity L-threonine aldolase [Acidobacteriia bacterium]|nr:low specificity L-threonine aldolase [Terriglobia bacterium]